MIPIKWTFNTSEELKEFAIHIANILEEQGKFQLSKEIHSWCSTAYSTSSEYLGEIRIIMQSILAQKTLLDDAERKSIKILIEAINNAFRNANGG